MQAKSVARIEIWWSIATRNSLLLLVNGEKKGNKKSQTMQLWYPLTRGSYQPHPAFSGSSGLQYHNSPTLTFRPLSCLCIFIFPDLPHPLFWFCVFLSFTAPLWPEPYRCQSPWRWADRHPTPFLWQTQKEGENERKEGLCVRVIPFSSSWENGIPLLSVETADSVLMRKLYWMQMGPERKKHRR